METKVRPIPITILDILAILLPGYVWLVLLIATSGIFNPGDSGGVRSPWQAWRELAEFTRSESGWLAPISLIISALIIGYATKPPSTRIASLITTPLLKLRYPGATLGDLKFPYAGVFRDTPAYAEVQKLIKDVTRCEADELYGKQPFSAAKRYLRLVSPALWEESERMEAEVRMIGAIFLAALYSIILSIVALAQTLLVHTNDRNPWVAGEWLALSAVAAIVLASSFNTMRVREVGYTYMNALIARGSHAILPSRGEMEADE